MVEEPVHAESAKFLTNFTLIECGALSNVFTTLSSRAKSNESERGAVTAVLLIPSVLSAISLHNRPVLCILWGGT